MSQVEELQSRMLAAAAGGAKVDEYKAYLISRLIRLEKQSQHTESATAQPLAVAK